MSNIMYENEQVLLTFQYPDIIEVLSARVGQHCIEEDSMLLKWLRDNSMDGQQDVRVPGEDGIEKEGCIGRIVYVIRDLLLKGKGGVHCKECDRDIPASMIRKDRATLLDAHKGIDKKTVKDMADTLGIKKGARGPIRLPASGRTTFYCDNGHEIFGTLDWIT